MHLLRAGGHGGDDHRQDGDGLAGGVLLPGGVREGSRQGVLARLGQSQSAALLGEAGEGLVCAVLHQRPDHGAGQVILGQQLHILRPVGVAVLRQGKGNVPDGQYLHSLLAVGFAAAVLHGAAQHIPPSLHEVADAAVLGEALRHGDRFPVTGQLPGDGLRAGERGFHGDGIPHIPIRRKVKGDCGLVGLAGKQDLVALVHAAGVDDGAALLGQLRGRSVKDHLHRAVIPGRDHARHGGFSGDVDSRAAPHHQPPLDGDVIEVQGLLPQAVGENQVAFKHSVLDAYCAPHQNRVPVGAGEITGIVDTLEDIAHDLRHLRTGDLALGVQTAIVVTADVAPLYHGGNAVRRPRAYLVPVREPGKGGVTGRGQADRPGQHHHGLFAGDIFIRPHTAVGVPGKGPHVDRLGDVVMVPAPTGHIREAGNVGALVGAKQPVYHSGHLCAGKIAVWVQPVLGRTHQHTVVHRPRQGFIGPMAVGVAVVRNLVVIGGVSVDGQQSDHHNRRQEQRKESL